MIPHLSNSGLDPWLLDLELRLDIVARFEHFVENEADPWQTQALVSTADTVAMRVCRQAGKSSILATVALDAMARAQTVLVIAPAERQARELARRVMAFLPKTGLIVERSTLTEVEVSTGGRLICVPSTAETIRGYTVDLLLIDEAAYCDDDTIAAVLPMLTDDGRVVFASTPGGRTGHFAEIFLEGAPSPNIERITVRGTDIPRLARKVERMRAGLSSLKFRQESEVEFLGDGESYFDVSRIQMSEHEVLVLQ